MASKSGCCSNSECPTGLAMIQHCLDTGEGADVTFLVGTGKEQMTILAHKFILRTASPVFKAMFDFDKMQHTDGEPIVVPDVEGDAFRMMLKYIYTNALELTVANVFPLLGAADKYAIEGLRRACLNFSFDLNALDANDVLVLLEQSHFNGMENAVQRCLQHIDNNAAQLFESDGFLKLDPTLLSLILERSSLRLDENQIYSSVVQWVIDKHQKKNPDMLISEANLRQIFEELLGPPFHYIRFPLISERKLTQEIVPSGLLTDKEVISVLMYHLGQPMPKGCEMPFVAEQRAGSDLFKTKSELAQANKRYEMKKEEVCRLLGQIEEKLLDVGRQSIISFLLSRIRELSE